MFVARPLRHILLLSLAFSPLSAAPTFRTVALSGNTAPGAGGTFSSLNDFFAINGSDLVVYSAITSGLTGNTSTLVDGFWKETAAGTSAAIAYYGQTATGITPSATHSAFYMPPVFLDNGKAAFRMDITTSRPGLWYGDSSARQALVVKDQSAPGLTGVTFSNPDLGTSTADVMMNQTGDYALGVTLAGTGVTTANDTAIFRGLDAGAPSLVVREGQVAPGAGGTATFTAVKAGTTSVRGISPDGSFGFAGRLNSSATNNEGIWFAPSSGALELTVRKDGASGISNYTKFGSPGGDIQLNSANRLLFPILLSNVATTINSVWVKAVGASPELVVRSAIAAPEGGNFIDDVDAGSGSDIQTRAIQNDAGDVVFAMQTSQSAATRWGLWKWSAGSRSKVIRQGDQAPGLASGTRIGVDSPDESAGLSTQLNPFFNFQLNKFGHVAFHANVTGAGVGNPQFTAIFAQDQNGDFQLIARTGASFALPGGGTKTVQAMWMGPTSSENSGRARTWNDNGKLAFKLAFSDNTSGLFVATVYSGLPSLDNDNDGLPNAWETAYGLDPDSDVDPNGATHDFDLDGVDNLTEYVAGTAPNDNTSFLSVQSVDPSGAITWNSVTGRNYQVERATTLLAPVVWQPVGGVHAGTGLLMTIPVTGEGYYRVRVSLP
jgi:hypothetical protein